MRRVNSLNEQRHAGGAVAQALDDILRQRVERGDGSDHLTDLRAVREG